MKARTKVRGKLAAVLALALAGAFALAACSGAPAETKGSAMGTANATGTNDSMMGTADTAGTEDSTMATTSAAASDAYAKITADEAKALMDEGSPTIVDVRTAKEYADGHIPGAVNIPVESIGTEKPAELADTDTDADLIVYCRTGVRSKQASDKLVGMGFRHVNDMGGIVDWHGETVTGAEPGGK